MSAVIVDDGTLDTVVEYDGRRIRYDTAYRYSFDSDRAFLNAASKNARSESNE